MHDNRVETRRPAPSVSGVGVAVDGMEVRGRDCSSAGLDTKGRSRRLPATPVRNGRWTYPQWWIPRPVAAGTIV